MNKQILRLAIPNILSNLSVPLLGAVDTAVIGHLEEVYYLGAIAVGSIVFDFIFWGFGFLRMGTTGLVAQAYGAGNEIETRRILLRVLLVALSASLAILFLQWPILELSLRVINASPEVENFMSQYYQIRIYSAPATLALFAFNGWFLGMQNARFPMYITILLNVVNIVLNLLLVLKFNLNVSGVAWGSLIASYVGVSVAIFLYRLRYHTFFSGINWGSIFDTTELKKFFSVNSDIFIRTLCLIFSYAFFIAKSAESGDVILAANTILLQLWYISAYGVDGFAFAAESLVGKYKGAKDTHNLNSAIKGTLLWGLGLGFIGSIVYWFSGDVLITIFTDQEMVIQAAGYVLIWTILAPLINSICFIWDGVYIGATSTAAMRNSMLIATFLVFVPVFYITQNLLGVHALWLSMFAFMVVRGISLTLLAPGYIFNTSLLKLYRNL